MINRSLEIPWVQLIIMYYISCLECYFQSDLMSYGLRGSVGLYIGSGSLLTNSMIRHRLLASDGVYHQSDLMSYSLRGSTGLYINQESL